MSLSDSMTFSEPWVGRNPKTVYAVKVVGPGQDGKKHTYIFLHASKPNYDRMVQQLPKGLIGESDTVTTYLGTVEWEETGKLDPLEKVVKMPEPKKSARQARRAS